MNNERLGMRVLSIQEYSNIATIQRFLYSDGNSICADIKTILLYFEFHKNIAQYCQLDCSQSIDKIFGNKNSGCPVQGEINLRT